MNLSTLYKKRENILKLIDQIDEKIKIDNILIEEEYKTITQIRNKDDFSKINTNVKKEDIDENGVYNSTKFLTEIKESNTSQNTETSKVGTTNPLYTMTDKERLEYLHKRSNESDEKFFETIKPILDTIPESNGCRYYDKIQVNIGIIADEFLMNSYEGIANFYYITPDNYKEFIGKIDLFMVVTAWKGLNMEWKGLGNPKVKDKREKLYEIIQEYKKENIKVIFYSKEDPVNYDIFKDIAKECDYIYTTCDEIRKSYKEYCNNDKVDVLKFGVNPTYHNPIGIKSIKKRDEVIFSGSWYKKYPHRIEDMKMMFDGVLNSKLGLKIIDRNYDLKLQQYFFPEKYLKNISPAIAHEYLQKTHKLFNWAINFNSVKDSNTMFANRIYELQALGNIMISNYSVGVNNLFPGIFLINDTNEVKHIIDSYNDEDIYQHQIEGIRSVMSNENSFLRIHELLNKLNIKHNFNERKVLVVTKKVTGKVMDIFNKQSYSNKDIIEEGKFFDKIKSKYDIIAFMSDEKEYGRYYLEDLVNAFKYTNCSYITKDSYLNGEKLIEGIEHNYVSIMKDKYRTVFWASDYTCKFLKKIYKNEKMDNGYSTDHFEYNNVILAKHNKVEDYKLSVIIAAYNNGEHLYKKCFNSLRRSSMFNDMEIIIVDDGSTDKSTQDMVMYLGDKFSNVKTYIYNDGGSGTASRPRNKGVEMSTTNYITFLDPDNEAVNDGYAQLYKELECSDLDMVIGNMIKLDRNGVTKFDYHRTAMIYNNKNDIIDGNKKEFLTKTFFKGMSIQALLVKKDIIIKNNLKQIVGAVGQDTLFFYELLVHSDKVKAIKLDIHIYYAAVEGSTVNAISKNYFAKAEKIERAKYEFYKRNGLLEIYISSRFEYYFRNWYLQKLTLVKAEEFEECKEIVKEIYKLYSNNKILEDLEIKELISV